jgi:serine/threonine protein kinase
MLVYDYMPNKSLDTILFPNQGMSNMVEFTWDLWCNILIGVSSTLPYLYEEWKQCVVHQEMKTSNVMFDQDINAHLESFGLIIFINLQTTVVTIEL